MQTRHPLTATQDHKLREVFESFLSALASCGVVVLLGFFLSL